MRSQRLMTVVLALLFVAAGASAQQALNSDSVNRWADSMEEIERWGEQQPEIDDSFEEPEDAEDFEASLARMARQDPEIERIISRHGFSGIDQWAEIGSRIIYAYGAVQMSRMAPDLEQEMQRQMEQMEQDESLSEEQREMMRQQFEQAMGLMGGMSDVSEQDRAAIRANSARLDQLFNN